VLGDGRLTLAAAPRGSYDLLILDAFSSDSIPTHLVTREALDLYVDKLADGGVLAFHGLEPVSAPVARCLRTSRPSAAWSAMAAPTGR